MSPNLILGIDEAGRGPVMGPLVMCGVWVRPAQQKALLELGVKDSKAFGSSEDARLRRAALAEAIRKMVDHVSIISVDAIEIDRRCEKGELNQLERDFAQMIIENGPPASKIIADGERLFSALQVHYPQLCAKNHADRTSPLVAAASIIAKDERDVRFREIVQGLHLDEDSVHGGGYPNLATAVLLRNYFALHGRLPKDVRQSWSWPILQDIDTRARNDSHEN